MKICPTCQATYPDDSMSFCLNDGSPLVSEQDARQQVSAQRKSGAPLILTILGAFLLFGLIVGGAGLYLFARRENGNAPVNSNAQKNQAEKNQKKTEANSNANTALPSVQIESNNANARNQASAGVSAPLRIVGSASSVRKPDKGNFYFPNFAFDSNPTTAWCEGADGSGIDEWLKFEFQSEVTLRQIKIEPGYFKSAQIWRDNNRVAEALLEFSDGSEKEVSFPDQMQTQIVDVGRVKTGWVKITIQDVYEGEHDSEDTLISEVSFVTEP